MNQPPDRRKFLKSALSAAAGLAIPHKHLFARHHNDDALLEDLAHRCFQYFWDASDPQTGICRDLIHADPADNLKKGDEARGSTGVTGFSLTALCIGAERKWIKREQAKDRARRALRSYTSGLVPNEHGWFYHFLDIHTGQRWKNVEMSTSDSIWLLAGVLTCRAYFHEDHEIADLATLLYSRYDFLWMTNGDGKLLSHGWNPEGYGSVVPCAAGGSLMLTPDICIPAIHAMKDRYENIWGKYGLADASIPPPAGSRPTPWDSTSASPC